MDKTEFNASKIKINKQKLEKRFNINNCKTFEYTVYTKLLNFCLIVLCIFHLEYTQIANTNIL